MRQTAVRAVFVAALAAVLSLSTTEATEDALNPNEVGESSRLGDSGPTETVPIEVVRAFSKKIEAENMHLRTVNSALRTTAEVSKAQQKVMVAGGLLPEETKDQKAKDKALKNEAQGLPKEKIPDKSEMSPEMRKGAKVIGEYQKKQNELENKLAKAQMQISASKAQNEEAHIEKEEKLVQAKETSEVEPSEYHRIPFFSFTAGAKTLENIPDRESCQQVCDRQVKCLSFSWSTKHETCMWSVDAVHYDQDYTFGVKAQIATAGDPEAQYRMFPGVKFITAHSKQKENMEFAACKAQCDSDTACKSFSYRRDTKFCAWSNNGMGYDEDFTYFEKDKYSDSANANVKRANEKLAKAKDKMQAQMAIDQGKEKTQKDGEERENELKQKTKQAWMANAPSNSQETHLKMTVKMEMSQMDAKFADKAAKKKEDVMAKAEKDLQQAQLAAIAKISKLEADGKKANADKSQEAKELPGLEEKLTLVKVAVAKTQSKQKVLLLDYHMKKKAAQKALADVDRARASENVQAISSTQGAYNDAKRAVADAEDERGKLDVEMAKLKNKLNDAQSKYDVVKGKEKNSKAMASTAESNTKAAVKAEKTALAKQKAAIEADRDKALTAKIVSLKAREKFAKGNRAQAKVDIQNAEEDLKAVKSESDRRDAEKEMADARGKMFKGDKNNEETTEKMVDIARKLAASKEGLHKAKAKVRKAKKTSQRQDVNNKLDALENAAGPKSRI